LAKTAFNVADIVADLAGAAPVFGQVIAAAQVGVDLIETGIEVAKCN